MARPNAQDVVTIYEEAKTLRMPYEHDWRMAAAYCMPRHYAAWNVEGPAVMQGGGTQETRRFAYDNTGVRSVPKYIAILNRLATPEGQRWHTATASDPNLMKIYAVREYFNNVTDLLFKYRYNPRGRFVQTVGETYGAIGVYGIGPMSVTWRRASAMNPYPGINYKAWNIRDVFLMFDDEGNVTHVFRRFYLNARQFKIKFPDEPMPDCLAAEENKPPKEMNMYEFVHVLHYRMDYDPKSLTARRHRVCSSYICVKDCAYVGDDKDGYGSMPMLTPRVFTESGFPYGYSAAMQAMPALGGVSAMKKTVLKQGQKAVDPPILANDDGVLSGRVDIRPGRTTYGAVNQAGQRLVYPMEMGNFQVAENLIADERKDIEDAFFVTLFQILTETPEMTATEVMERVAEKAALLAPTMGRLQTEMLGPNIEREIEVLHEAGLLPEMPPELAEARGEYEVVYTSPLAKGQYAEEVSGFMRWSEMLLKFAEVTQDPSPTDWINMDDAAPAIADRMAVRTAWVNDPKKVEGMREDRAEKQQQQAVLDQAPAIASVAKEAMKNGGGVPGVSN